MLYTLSSIDTSTASITLSELSRINPPAIHWTPPPEYVASTSIQPGMVEMISSPMRELSALEEEVVWKALFASGETLYSL